MHRSVFAIYMAISFLIIGCTTAPEIFGGVSADEVCEITALVRSRSDIRKPVLRITAEGHNRATVETGRNEKAGDIAQRFTVAKKLGKWSIVSPIDEEKISFVGTPYASGPP
jgi:hypothetical protein